MIPIGGIAPRSYYATPYELRRRPWAPDFTPDDAGAPAYPLDYIINPYYADPFLEWTTGDWDPALRFWTLPFDTNLTEWLQSSDPSRPSILAAREFAGRYSLWSGDRKALLARGWIEESDVKWQPDEGKRGTPGWADEKEDAWTYVRAEIVDLQELMQDDRDRYLWELDVQADGLADYLISFIGANGVRHPWTIELLNCGLAIGNIAYMYFKQQFKRVRPSFLCPGLIPPFGPPMHPSFPSGHSFLGHFCALLLLEIPALRQRYGICNELTGGPGSEVKPYPYIGQTVTINNPNGTPLLVTISPQSRPAANAPIAFQSDPEGSLPAAIKPEATYYVLLQKALPANQFQISEKPAGTAIVGNGNAPVGTYKASSPPANPLHGRTELKSPLLWLAERLGKNRERLGVHYASDTMASRHLAAAIWRALLKERDANKRIVATTLDTVLRHAKAEWDTNWP